MSSFSEFILCSCDLLELYCQSVQKQPPSVCNPTCSMAKPCILAWHEIKLMKHHQRNPNLQRLLAKAWFEVNDKSVTTIFFWEHFMFKKRKPSPSPSWTKKNVSSPTFQFQPFFATECFVFHQPLGCQDVFVFPQIWYRLVTVYHPLPFTPQPDVFVATPSSSSSLGLPWASPLFPLQLVPMLFRLQRVPLVSHVVLRRPQFGKKKNMFTVNSLRVSSELRTWFLRYGAIYIYITCMYNILPSLKLTVTSSTWKNGWSEDVFFRFPF